MLTLFGYLLGAACAGGAVMGVKGWRLRRGNAPLPLFFYVSFAGASLFCAALVVHSWWLFVWGVALYIAARLIGRRGF